MKSVIQHGPWWIWRGSGSYTVDVDLQLVPHNRYSRTNTLGTHLLISEGWTAELTVVLGQVVPMRFELTIFRSWTKCLDISAMQPQGSPHHLMVWGQLHFAQFLYKHSPVCFWSHENVVRLICQWPSKPEWHEWGLYQLECSLKLWAESANTYHFCSSCILILLHSSLFLVKNSFHFFRRGLICQNIIKNW